MGYAVGGVATAVKVVQRHTLKTEQVIRTNTQRWCMQHLGFLPTNKHQTVLYRWMDSHFNSYMDEWIHIYTPWICLRWFGYNVNSGKMC